VIPPASPEQVAATLADTLPAADDAPLARALTALLACGKPVTHERLAAATGRPVGDVVAALNAWPNVRRDDHGASSPSAA
jgi:hypothetical protein